MKIGDNGGGLVEALATQISWHLVGLSVLMPLF